MRRVLLTVVTACSGTVATPPLTNHATHGKRLACSDVVARITHTLAARWDAELLDVRCAAGHFGVDGFFIAARGVALHKTGIVDASAAELVAFVDEPIPAPSTFLNGYQTADLDGDGEDEIIESWRRSEHEGLDPDNWLIVRRIASGRFSSKIRGPYVTRHYPDLGGCFATWEARAGMIRVAVGRKRGIAPVDCLSEGTHQFALQGRALIERHQPRARR